MLQFHKKALARLAIFCLSTGALTVPVLAASFSVGGGTITTGQTDVSVDNTGASGGFELQANTTGSNDIVSISNVTINYPGGRTLDIGGNLPSSGSYSVTMHGTTLTGGTGGWFQSVGGLISLDTTGGAANTMSGALGLTVTNGTSNGAVALNLGADTINSTAEAVQAIGQGTGTISIDMAGTTVTSTGTYGVVAQNGLGNITIGGLNGGISGGITASSGFGIFSSSNGTISVAVSSSGNITALNALYLQGNADIVNNFGTINGTNNAIDASFANSLSVILQSGSAISGILLGSHNSDTFTLFGGANIAGASFNGNGGTDALILTGSSNGTFSLASATNIASFQMQGSGIWTLTGSAASSGGWTVASGTLRAGGNINPSAVTINGGIFDVNGQAVTVGALSGTGGTITLGSGSLSTAFVGTSTLAAAISGSGSLTTNASGTLILTGTNSYTGGTTLNGGTLQIGNGGTTGSIAGDVGGFGTLSFNRSDSLTFGGVISGNMIVRQDGAGTTVLTGANTYAIGTVVNAGTLQLAAGGKLGNAALTVNGGTLDLNNTNQTVGAATGTGGRITLGSGTLTVTGNVGGALSSVISGTGGVVISAGALKLAADNTYTGGTIVTGTGTLIIGNGGTTGSVIGSITNNSVLEFNHSDSYTFGSVVSGSGQLQHGGAGTLILTGANTYTGGTQISFGTLQIGNGGTTGSIVGDVVAGGAGIAFDRSDDITFAGVISGSNVSQIGSGTVTLTGINTFNNVIRVSQGSLIIGPTGSLTSLNNQVLLSGTGSFFSDATLSMRGLDFSGGTSSIAVATGKTISFNLSLSLTGSGTMTFGSPARAGTISINASSPTVSSLSVVVAGGTLRDTTSSSNSSGGGAVSVMALAASQFTVNTGAVVDFNDHSVRLNSNPALGANLRGAGQILLGSNAATEMRLKSTDFSGVISGAGRITFLSNASQHVLGGDNTYTGGTTINPGATLQLGNGGTTGAVAGNIVNNGVLIFDRSDAGTFANIISGSGSLTKLGSNSLTLSGINAYTGATPVSAGTLNITGAIGSSSVSVASGATLGGTGTVGSTTIASGGTLAPGNSIGTLSVNGNLILASGSVYSVEVSPSAADRTNVSGSASLNGTVAASVASGTYSFGQRFTVINATGGVSGTFASLTGIPTSLRGQLSYDANNAYLSLSPNALAPSLTNATSNQQKLVTAIDAAAAAGSVPGGGFVALYGLSGPALNSALDQISGQVGPNTINAVGQGSLSFLTMTAQGGSDRDNFAPGSAFGGADAPHRAQLGAGATRVWGAVYGGHVGLSADAASGAASLSSNNVGLIGGIDMAWDEGLLAGVTLGLGQQHFSSGNGTGSSDDIMIGVYARKDAGPFYAAASFGYGSHHIETLRLITVSGTDVMQGKQRSHDYGGRIEAGWRLALDDQYRLAPYFALAAESFESPAYAESALSGASTFALSFAAHSSTLGRTELGSGLSRDYETENGMLTAALRAAWAHQLDDLPLTQASFQSLPGASFLVTGVRPASDTALLGASVELQNRSGLFFGFKGETQLGAGTTILEGMGHLGWRW